MADAPRLDVPSTGGRRLASLIRYNPDAVGATAETFARFLGTGRYLAIQTIIVIVWIALNVFAVRLRWDPYPFILLNLAFSTQAAYAAPLILLAQTRQADRDHAEAIARERHHDEAMERQTALLQQVEALTQAMGEHLRRDGPPA